MNKIKTYSELRDIVVEGNIPLETLNISEIDNLSFLFQDIEKINGSIAGWDVSNVKSMESMFLYSEISPDISSWDTSSVTNMKSMFAFSKFNEDISKFVVSNVENMEGMFRNSIFNKDISDWDVFSVENMNEMFFKSEFNQDLSKWDVRNVWKMNHMFQDSKFNKTLGTWYLSNKQTISIFKDCPYSLKRYDEDREKFFNNLQLIEQKAIEESKQKYLLEEEKKLNKELNKEVELSIIEMEF